MTLLQDRQVRRFVCFLLLFAVMLLVAGLQLGAMYSRAAQNLYLDRSAEIASALLGQGVSETVVASAMQSDSVTPDGLHLLELLGMTERTSARLLPTLHAFMSARRRPYVATLMAIIPPACRSIERGVCFNSLRRWSNWLRFCRLRNKTNGRTRNFSKQPCRISHISSKHRLQR